MMAADGSFLVLFERPFAATFFIISVLTLCWPLYQEWRQLSAREAT